jgi:hypothetical protein
MMRNYEDVTHPKDVVTKEYLIGQNILFNDNISLGVNNINEAIERLYNMIELSIALSDNIIEGGDSLEDSEYLIIECGDSLS